MLNGLAASQYNPYQAQSVHAAKGVQGASVRTAAVPQAQPEMPVTPVTPVRPTPAVQSGPVDRNALLARWENDPAAMAVRGRIQYAGDAQALQNPEEAVPMLEENTEEAKSAQELMEEAECQTCKERKYQDGSDDPGVSFKTASHIDPDQAAAVVRGHEQEHVVREQAQADREDREVVSQTVTLHTGICPECGRTYVSGGTTRTVTRAQQEQEPLEETNPDEKAA